MTHNTREVEGLSLEIGGGTKATLYVGLTLEKRHLEMIDQALHHQLQKAREEGARDAAAKVADYLISHTKYMKPHSVARRVLLQAAEHARSISEDYPANTQV